MSLLLTYYLANHPLIVNFRWSHSESYGSTWSFLILSLSVYVVASLSLHVVVQAVPRAQRRAIRLGPIPALHSLLISVVSGVIFLGLLVSSVQEIKETRWLWRRTRTQTSFQWLLCFPLGTRPSGRVFFWSYLFYLSRFLHLFRTFFSILRGRGDHALAFRMFSHSALICMSFLWLEFTQSFQVLAILSATLAHVVVFGYRFWSNGNCFPVVVACQLGMLGCNLVCHLGFLMFHFWRGGCSGVQAWVFNSVLNAALLMLFLNSYVRTAVNPKQQHLLDQDVSLKDD